MSNEHWHRRSASHSLSIESCWHPSALALALRITYHGAHVLSSASWISNLKELAEIGSNLSTRLLGTTVGNNTAPNIQDPNSTNLPDMAAISVVMACKSNFSSASIQALAANRLRDTIVSAHRRRARTRFVRLDRQCMNPLSSYMSL